MSISPPVSGSVIASFEADQAALSTAHATESENATVARSRNRLSSPISFHQAGFVITKLFVQMFISSLASESSTVGCKVEEVVFSAAAPTVFVDTSVDLIRNRLSDTVSAVLAGGVFAKPSI